MRSRVKPWLNRKVPGAYAGAYARAYRAYAQLYYACVHVRSIVRTHGAMHVRSTLRTAGFTILI